MGCTSSKSASPSKPRAKPSATPASAARPANPAPAPAPAPSYDTVASASLSVAPGGPTVAFYGILAPGTKRLDLASRASEAAPDRRRLRPAAGGDNESCRESDGMRLEGVAMTMPWTVVVGKEVPGLRAVIDQVFDLINRQINGWNEDSAISRLNQAPAGKDVALSPTVLNLFKAVDGLFERTGGRFDPTASVLTLAWAKALVDNGRPPLGKDVAHLRHAIGWQRLRRKDGNAARGNANTVIDVDGVAKGLGVDMVFEAVRRAATGAGVYVDWAGDIRAWGDHPSGRSWRTAVLRPPGLQDLLKAWGEDRLYNCLEGASATHLVDMVAPDDGFAERGDVARLQSGLSSGAFSGGIGARGGVAMATSGDYFHMQKFGFHHIADPTGMGVMKAGARSIASVSVMAHNCALADGLATAAMTFETAEEADAFLAGLVRALPKEVYGHCIISRTPEYGTKVMVSPFFSRVSETGKDAISGQNGGVVTGGVLDGGMRQGAMILGDEDDGGQRLSPDGVAAVCAGVPRITCLLSFPGSSGGAQVDSFQSLSMNPEPCVSFTVKNSVIAERDLTAVRCAIDFAVGSGELADAKPASLTIQVTNLLRVSSEVSVAIGAVCAVDQGNARSMCLNYGPKNVSFGLTRHVQPSEFAQMQLLGQVKAVLRRVPAIVWVVATQTAQGTRHALTASSVASSAVAPDVLTFNVMDTNVFTAAFGGAGSTVEVFALVGGQDNFASKFVSKTTMTDGDFEGLTIGAALHMTVDVAHTSFVQDHMLVIGRVTSALQPGGMKKKAPLVWLDKKYETL